MPSAAPGTPTPPTISDCRRRVSRSSWCRRSASSKRGCAARRITPGYWRSPALTAEAFDDEGFYRLGDAFQFADPDDPQQGLLYEGRVAEDFKLSSGTWVSVGTLRAKLIEAFAPLARDAVLAGANRDDIAALIFPDLDACRELAALPAGTSAGEVLMHAAVRDEFRRRLHAHGKASTGSSTRVSRVRAARGASLARPRRDHRQRLDQPACGSATSRPAGGRSLRQPAAAARHRGGEE